MHTEDFVDIAFGALQDRDVDVVSMEPAEFSPNVVGALSQIAAELAGNASAFSGPTQSVAVVGGFEGDDYVISISDDGVGIPEPMLAALNRVLASPPSSSSEGLSLGIAVVARLAARHDIRVRLLAAERGTTARVSVPGDLVSRPDDDPQTRRRSEPASPAPPQGLDVNDFIDEFEEAAPTEHYEREFKSDPAHVVSMSETARAEAEEFLEIVFGPLRPSGKRQRPPARNGPQTEDRSTPAAPVSPAEGPVEPLRTDLEVRVPGVNFRVVEDDRSVASSEAAVDLKSALSRYQEGREGAAEGSKTPS